MGRGSQQVLAVAIGKRVETEEGGRREQQQKRRGRRDEGEKRKSVVKGAGLRERRGEDKKEGRE